MPAATKSPPGVFRPVALFALAWLVALLVAALVLTGCSSMPVKHAECDETKVAAFTARCAAQVKLLCDPDPAKPCEAEMLCEAELCELCPKADGCDR